MSQHKVEEGEDLQPKKPEPMRVEEESYLFTAIMMALCLILAIAYLIVEIIKHGH